MQPVNDFVPRNNTLEGVPPASNNEKESQMECCLRDLQLGINLLSSLLNRLNTRLAPVVIPDIDKEDIPKDPVPPLYLHERIKAMSMSLSKINSRIVSILDGLTL